jgi:hypothetical protein
MSTLEQVPAPPVEPVVAPAPSWPARALRSDWTLAIGLYLVVAAVHTVLALRTALPLLYPDEFRYSHLARSLADGDGFVWRGMDIKQTTALYSYFLAPAYLVFHSTVDAWRASQVMGTLVLCTQLFPVWLLSRELLGRTRLAFVPAVLAVVGTWMVSSAELVTEVLAFPLTTGALCAAVMALRRPGGRWGWVALGLLVLATWARIQVAALVPALLITLVVDVLRDPAQRRARLHAHRPLLVVLGAGVVLLSVAALAFPSLAGDYEWLFHDRPSFGRSLSMVGWQLMELVATAAFLPVVLAAAAAMSRRAWRDDAAGPLLAVFWPVALTTVVQSGFFLATQPASISPIGRYVTYAVPIALVLAAVLVVRPHLVSRVSLAIAALAALGLLARPATKQMAEERASWITSYRLHELLGVGPGVAMLIVTFVLLGLVVALRARRVAPMRAALVTGLALAAVLVAQSQGSWWQHHLVASSFRTVMPADLEWVDHHAGGPVALLGVTENAPQFDDIDFFNRKITQAYGPPDGIRGRQGQGYMCEFRLDESGTLTVSPACGPEPHGFLINDPSARVTFYNETHAASDPNWGRVVQVAPTGPARARSLVILACSRITPTYHGGGPRIDPVTQSVPCRPAITGALWLDAPTTLAITYRGGRKAQVVTFGGRRWPLPAGVETTVRMKVPSGYSRFSADQDWRVSGGTPQVRAITLTSAGQTTPLI